MTEYLTYRDSQLLRDAAFTLGVTGASWFGTDKDGQGWQAYVIDGDTNITFVPDKTRYSTFMSRAYFQELFL